MSRNKKSRNHNKAARRLQGPGRRHGTRMQGFTLLEVMVALTIAGLALGGLLGVIAGNKRLAWRAEQALLEASRVRNIINFSQLGDRGGELPLPFDSQGLRLDMGLPVPVSKRKTLGTTQALRAYELVDENDEVVASGIYWTELDLPQ